jgi:hypothetical protein
MRRFQFSLRTLLIVVTAICLALGGYVGWQKKIVRDRKAMLVKIVERERHPYREWPGLYRMNWIREWLGDQPIVEIVLPPDSSFQNQDFDEIEAAFPEAHVHKW